MSKMWFGIPGSHMQWVPCPSIESSVQRNRYTERMQFENGGGDARRSSQYQLEYQFTFSGPAHEVEGIDAFNKFAQGFYGDGLIQLAHPANYETNMLPAAWATPALIEQGWTNISSLAPTFANTNVTSYGQPQRTATWNVADDAGTAMKEVTIPIPPTHTLHLGVSGIATGYGVVRARPIKADGTFDTPTDLTLLSKSSSTRMNTTFSGADYQAVQLYITRSNNAFTTRVNRVKNPSFSINTYGWGPLVSAAISRDSSFKYSGAASLKVVTPGVAPLEGTYSGIFSNPDLTAGSKFSVSAMVIAPLDSTLEIIAASTGAGVGNVSTTITGTGDWQLVKAENATLGAGLNPYLVIRTKTSAQPITFYVDNAIVETGTTVGTYFDGSTSNSVFTKHAWTGTENASNSTEISQPAATVSITSAMAQLYKTGTTPVLPTTHYQGEGSTGLVFADDAIVENYSYMYPPRKGISTTLVEVGAWR